MSVSAITYYSPADQYQYFGISISDAQVKVLLEKYGIQPTGNSDKDLRALYEVMYADAKSSVSASQSSSSLNNSQQVANQATEAGNSTNVPWASLMSQVGLSATGDLATDYEAFAGKISVMQSSGAASQQNQATINQLMAEASIVFIQQTNSAPQSSAQSQNSSQTVTGADIQAQLNKMYFLNTEV